MNITALRRIWFSISATLMLLSIITVGVFGLNLGLDFTGGARWDLKFNEPTSTTELVSFFDTREELSQEVTIQASTDNTYLITIEDLPDASIQSLSTALESEVGDFEQTSYRKVDANIGQSFKQKSLLAIAAALIGIILFVAYAFRKIPAAVNPWRFGGVAIIALIHDIIIVLGIFVLLGSIFDVELDLPFITALLATLGFSVNDTIVILDRVRENIRLQKPEEDFEDTVEKSIQQTLFRSLNTSISTLLPLLALLYFEAESIFFFVLALTIGIIVGTYSSIFLAAPMLVEWKKIADKR
ncbi:protein translocase subunit SecF [bacterium]|nr:protein translocase subunit SecF [bacterium]NCQ55760.1 protein translocase subunit SecF [Candidatus Parcubacteria bacterium]NCS67709.1 protein translocase subunit SecF [Candidatus Peregrinibacteria bacterium]NCS96723.1 protein translocase subunit SecF [bacterium]